MGSKIKINMDEKYTNVTKVMTKCQYNHLVNTKIDSDVLIYATSQPKKHQNAANCQVSAVSGGCGNRFHGDPSAVSHKTWLLQPR